jgi:hypothetical protein
MTTAPSLFGDHTGPGIISAVWILQLLLAIKSNPRVEWWFLHFMLTM